jgi:hypothetical protein
MPVPIVWAALVFVFICGVTRCCQAKSTIFWGGSLSHPLDVGLDRGKLLKSGGLQTYQWSGAEIPRENIMIFLFENTLPFMLSYFKFSFNSFMGFSPRAWPNLLHGDCEGLSEYLPEHVLKRIFPFQFVDKTLTGAFVRGIDA